MKESVEGSVAETVCCLQQRADPCIPGAVYTKQVLAYPVHCIQYRSLSRRTQTCTCNSLLQVLAKTTYWNKREVSARVSGASIMASSTFGHQPPASGTVYVVPAVWNPGQGGPFKLLVHANAPVGVRAVEHGTCSRAKYTTQGVAGAWSRVGEGGAHVKRNSSRNSSRNSRSSSGISPKRTSCKAMGAIPAKKGNVAGGSAGGSVLQSSTFHTNPQYILEVLEIAQERRDAPFGSTKDTAVVKLLLTRATKGKGKGFGSGITVLTCTQRLVGPASKDMVVGKAMFTDHQDVCRTVRLKCGRYLVVPAMLKPGTVDHFALQATSTAKFKLYEAPPRIRSVASTSASRISMQPSSAFAVGPGSAGNPHGRRPMLPVINTNNTDVAGGGVRRTNTTALTPGRASNRKANGSAGKTIAPFEHHTMGMGGMGGRGGTRKIDMGRRGGGKSNKSNTANGTTSVNMREAHKKVQGIADLYAGLDL